MFQNVRNKSNITGYCGRTIILRFGGDSPVMALITPRPSLGAVWKDEIVHYSNLLKMLFEEAYLKIIDAKVSCKVLALSKALPLESHRFHSCLQFCKQFSHRIIENKQTEVSSAECIRETHRTSSAHK